MTRSNLVQEIAVVAWFAVVLLSFFAPPEVMPPNVSIAVYGLFLVLGIAALMLRVLRRKDDERAEPLQAAAVPTADSAPKRDAGNGVAATANRTEKRAKARQRRDGNN